MSGSEQPIADNGNVGDEAAEKDDPKEEDKRNGFGEKGKKGKKKAYLFRLRKGKKKKILDQRKPKSKDISGYSCCLWRRRRGTSGARCCLCGTPPMTVESAGESSTSDPNSPAFTFDMLRSLIEKNDFYSKDCNPHLDAADD